MLDPILVLEYENMGNVIIACLFIVVGVASLRNFNAEQVSQFQEMGFIDTGDNIQALVPSPLL